MSELQTDSLSLTSQLGQTTIKEEDKGQCKDTDIVTPWEVHSQSSTGVDYDKLIR